MVSKTQKLLTGKKVPADTVRRRRKRRGGDVKRGTGKSATDTLENADERKRLEEEYIDNDHKKSIFNQKTAENAFDSMREWEGLDNLLNAASSSSRQDFIRDLREKHQKKNLREIKREEITLKSGEVRSGRYLPAEPEKYVIPIEILGKEYFQMRDRETGRFIGTFRADKYE